MSLKDYKHPRCDASENAFLRRELEHVRAGLYEVLFPNLKGRQLVPVDHNVHTGAEVTTYNIMEVYGKARVGGGYSSTPPRVDVALRDASQPIKPIFEAYGYSLQEVRNAMMTGRGLSQMKAKAAREVMEQEVDEVLLEGNSANSLAGLFSLSGTNTETVTSGAVGTLWADKTSDEKIADLNAAVNKIVTSTKDRIHPDTLVIPLTAFNDLNDNRMRDSSDTSILDHFLGKTQYIKNVVSSIKLETAGAASSRRLVAYKRSADMLQGIIPQEFEQLPPEAVGYETIINCHMRIGGIELYQPLSVCYMDAF